MVELRQLQRTPESPKAIEELGVSAEGKAVLVDRKLDTKYQTDMGLSVCRRRSQNPKARIDA